MVIKKIAAALAAVFALSAAPAAAADYEVLARHDSGPLDLFLPDRPLDFPGPRRDAQARWVKLVPFTTETYVVLLRAPDGGLAQCAGVRVTPQEERHYALLQYLDHDPLADDVGLLRILHRDARAADWPFTRGGCQSVSAAESAGLRDTRLYFRMGALPEGGFIVPLYGPEDEAETERKAQMARDGRGVSLRTNLNGCVVPGWRDDMAAAQPGARIALPGLCPR